MRTRARWLLKEGERREEQIKSEENLGREGVELHVTFQDFCQLQQHYFSHVLYLNYLHRSIKITVASLICLNLKIEPFYILVKEIFKTSG